MTRRNQSHKDLGKTLQAEVEQIQKPGRNDSDVQRNKIRDRREEEKGRAEKGRQESDQVGLLKVWILFNHKGKSLEGFNQVSTATWFKFLKDQFGTVCKTEGRI